MPRKKQPELTVTLSQIEGYNPCHSHYSIFLAHIKSNPTASWPSENNGYLRYNKSKFGPDDHIPLSLICKHHEHGKFWVEWLMEHELGNFGSVVDRENLKRDRETNALSRKSIKLGQERNKLMAKVEALEYDISHIEDDIYTIWRSDLDIVLSVLDSSTTKKKSKKAGA